MHAVFWAHINWEATEYFKLGSNGSKNVVKNWGVIMWQNVIIHPDYIRATHIYTI